jgi:hypothetical protein
MDSGNPGDADDADDDAGDALGDARNADGDAGDADDALLQARSNEADYWAEAALGAIHNPLEAGGTPEPDLGRGRLDEIRDFYASDEDALLREVAELVEEKVLRPRDEAS